MVRRRCASKEYKGKGYILLLEMLTSPRSKSRYKKLRNTVAGVLRENRQKALNKLSREKTDMMKKDLLGHADSSEYCRFVCLFVFFSWENMEKGR